MIKEAKTLYLNNSDGQVTDQKTDEDNKNHLEQPGRRDFLLVPSLPRMTCLVRQRTDYKIKKKSRWNSK